jgi:hypothetical protein
MRAERFTAAPILAQLKDFQRRTVDYVSERFYGPEPIRRFLVADEVGLGKTLVARGVIARAIEHLQDSVERIDIIYVCSNANIAKQNINRLNVSGENSFALATRLTLLPTKISELSKNFLNMVSFTPGTTFDLKRRAGLAEERALIFRMLAAEPWNMGRGLYNLMQATVTNRNNWGKWVTEWTGDIDPGLAHAFRERISVDEHLIRRLNSCCEKFKRHRKHVPDIDSEEQYQLIGELRHLLAETCLSALEPDLVILDEFQRFKNLLDGDDDAASLSRVLFNYPDVRTLLLSATPYKMLSLDHEQDDDHYPDFLRTLSFLFDNGLEVVQIEGDIQKFRRGLFALTEGNIAEFEEVRNRLQSRMLRVMCRTERVGMTQKLDAMLTEPLKRASLHPEDLDQASLVDKAARALGARDSIEYWKSSPYLLNFLKNYELRSKLDKVAEAPPADLVEALKKAAKQILQSETFERYSPIDPGNARLRLLFHETLDAGLWRLLWMPPSLPYMQPAGVYVDIGSITKALVFSAWNLVPDAIAALCSYEAERRMLEELGHDWSHSQLYDRVKPLLRFTKRRDNRLTGMPALAWLMPSPTLATTIDPLEIALRKGNGSPVPIDLLIAEVENCCEELLKKLPPGGPGTRSDERWYWVAPALLEAQSQLRQWCLAERGWISIGAGHEPGARFHDHVNLLVSALDGELELGPRPSDLPKVMAELALAGPGTCALRALRRIASELPPDDINLLSAAARVAGGFRTLFNLPETICLLRGIGEDTYWRLTLRYGIEGNIQALLDEQVHVLLESLGLVYHPPEARVVGIAESLAEALSIRTAQIKIDELALEDGAIKIRDFNSRCRFALRFGELKDDRDATLARADVVREAFNSPFRPFILASTSIGQEGLDFHTWCHAVIHWNLPSNPVDLEQREGRVQRYKGHAIRKNIAKRFGIAALSAWDRKEDPWAFLFQRAAESKPTGASDLVPYWIYEVEEGANIERRVPLLPFSREIQQLDHLKRSLVLYRLVFGQPRQEDLLNHLAERMSLDEAESIANAWRINLEPPS